ESGWSTARSRFPLRAPTTRLSCLCSLLATSDAPVPGAEFNGELNEGKMFPPGISLRPLGSTRRFNPALNCEWDGSHSLTVGCSAEANRQPWRMGSNCRDGDRGPAWISAISLDRPGG